MRFGLRAHAFVLMDNHYHLLLELKEANLSRAIQWLNVSYSVWFNRRHARSGHLFQGRFKSVLVSREEWALALSRYMHLNPVRIGRLGLNKSQQRRMRMGVQGAPEARQVQERIAALRRYRWSSYRSYIGLGKKPAWLTCGELLTLGGGEKGQEHRNYRDYVELAVREGLAKSPWEELKEQAVLGGVEFLNQVRKYVRGDGREQRAAARLALARPDLSTVIGCVERVKGERWGQFRDRHGDSGRDLVLYLGRKRCGLKLKELARAVEVNEYATVAMAVKRYELLQRDNAPERQQLQKVLSLLNLKM